LIGFARLEICPCASSFFPLWEMGDLNSVET
jgi:hypothetical protein